MAKRRPKEGWYLGGYKGRHLYECCYGFVITGYWYAGGPENEPYSHTFYGFTWAGKYTFGIGRVTHEDLLPGEEDGNKE